MINSDEIIRKLEELLQLKDSFGKKIVIKTSLFSENKFLLEELLELLQIIEIKIEHIGTVILVSNEKRDDKIQKKIQFFLSIFLQFLLQAKNGQQQDNTLVSQKDILSQLPDPPTINHHNEPNINLEIPEINFDEIQQKIEKRLNYKTEDSKLQFDCKLAHNRQMDQYRQKMKKKLIDERRKSKMEIMTFEKLEKKNQENSEFLNKEDPLGRECLTLSNKFRRENNKSELKWEPQIYNLALEHSKNMGNKKVPFGHKGFNQRYRSFPFAKSGGAENVAYCYGCDYREIAKTIVDGWINSPGHRKNLLGNFNRCTIASYKTEGGRYYFTQLFANRN